MIPTIIIAGIALLLIAASGTTEQPETIAGTSSGSGYIAPAADNAVPYGRNERYSELTSPTLVSGPHGTGTGQIGRASVYTPPLAGTAERRTSVAPKEKYVPPPAQNPVLERPATRSVPEVSPTPRVYEAPVSVSYRRGSKVLT